MVLLTVPGLVLLAATGLFMTLYSRLGFERQRWLTVHQIVGALILLNAALLLVPIGGELLNVFGTVNLVLALVTIFVATLKPALGQSCN